MLPYVDRECRLGGERQLTSQTSGFLHHLPAGGRCWAGPKHAPSLVSGISIGCARHRSSCWAARDAEGTDQFVGTPLTLCQLSQTGSCLSSMPIVLVLQKAEVVVSDKTAELNRVFFSGLPPSLPA